MAGKYWIATPWLILCGILTALGTPAGTSTRAVAQLDGASLSRTTQADLRALGFEPGVIDGQWRRQSLLALRRFQHAEGLAETGRADPETVTRLRERRQSVVAAARPAIRATTAVLPRFVSEAMAPPTAWVLMPIIFVPTSYPNASPNLSPLSPGWQSWGGSEERPEPIDPVGSPRSPAPRPASPSAVATGPGTTSDERVIGVAGADDLSGVPALGMPVSPWIATLVLGCILALWGLLRRRRKRPDEETPVVSLASVPEVVPDGIEIPGSLIPVTRPAGHPALTPVSHEPASDHAQTITVPAPPVPVAASTIAPVLGAPSAARTTFGTRTNDLRIPASIPAASLSTGSAARPAYIPRPIEPKIALSPHRLAGDRAWIPSGAHATVAGFSLPGLVYVGRVLPRMDGYGRNDSCLIDPGLAVSKSNGDTSGQHMDYWPAYESMRPSSRRGLLEWLSGGRSDPGAYIGYVFVFLYGLERRGVLERSREDRPAIRAEVERLLSVHGHNGSFHRYATDLLSALDVLDLEPGQDPAPVFVQSGGDVPPSVRIAVGSRIRDGRPIEADWLLAWTMSHPETRVRTPARRAFDHLRTEFAFEFTRRHPSGGLLLKGRKGKGASIPYRAASGSFTVGLESVGVEALADLSRYPEALTAGRELLEICTGRLDAFSRHLGRASGAATAMTLQSFALLPPARREQALDPGANEDLAWIRKHADSCTSVPFEYLNGRVSGQTGEKATPTRLREVADTLCRFGVGLIPDPRYPGRLPTSSVVLPFRLDAPCEAVPVPSDAYKAAFLALSVGMLVAKADGEVSDDERVVLREMASASPGLGIDERHRLAADATWLEAHPAELPSLRTRLAELGIEHRQSVGATLVRVASSDGNHHRAEISLLEKAFRYMGLDQRQLYAALHQAGPDAQTSRGTPSGSDDLVRVTLGTEGERNFVIPGASVRTPLVSGDPPARPAPVPGSVTAGSIERVDSDRLAAIRAETVAVSSVLSSVFDLDADPALPDGEAPMAVDTPDEGADAEDVLAGLDPRHAQLLRELVVRSDWPRAEFDRLAREFDLMPGAAMENLNDWAFGRFDDVLVEEGDPILINLHLIPDSLSEAA